MVLSNETNYVHIKILFLNFSSLEILPETKMAYVNQNKKYFAYIQLVHGHPSS